MSSFVKVDQLSGDGFIERHKGNEDKDIFDEGIFVSELNGEEDDNDDDFEFLQEPKTEFEKSLSKMNNITRQIDEDTQLLSHELKTLESKNQSTERRITKLCKDAEEFRLKLQAFLHSFTNGQPGGYDRESHEKTTTSSSRYHKTTLDILLKQNSIEQPVHVNISPCDKFDERSSGIINPADFFSINNCAS